MMDEKIKAWIKAHQLEYFADLQTLISIPSVRGAASVQAPFGVEPKRALEQMLALAHKYGFAVNSIANAVGYAQYGDGPAYIGVLGHLDVVAAGDNWATPPFELTMQADRVVGRGVLDNKGPLLTCLYALRCLKELEITPKIPIRLIFGTNEETGSQDLPLYLQTEPAPKFAFTPDGKFPVVYGERGIVRVTIETQIADQLGQQIVVSGEMASSHVPADITVTIDDLILHTTGVKSPSNAPELGENALTKITQELSVARIPVAWQNYFKWVSDNLHEQHHGEALKLDFSDGQATPLILTPYALALTDHVAKLSLALRYPLNVTETTVLATLAGQLPIHSQLIIDSRLPSVCFDQNRIEVAQLSKIYAKVTGFDSMPVTTTGATYARSFPNTVAFGPSLPGQKGIAHKENEFMLLKDIELLMEIYTLSLLELTK